MKIVIYSNNQNKINEIKNIFKDINIPIVGYKDIIKKEINVIEDGLTFEENAIKKVNAIKSHKNIIMADDSGLVVEALNGRPGIYSARYG